jgi:hypothetical protein
LSLAHQKTPLRRGFSFCLVGICLNPAKQRLTGRHTYFLVEKEPEPSEFANRFGAFIV